MTDDDIRERARASAGQFGMNLRSGIADRVPDKLSHKVWATPGVIEYVNAFLADVVSEERERCARIAERFGSKPAPGNDGMGTRILLPVDGLQVAAAIRRAE